MQKNKAQLIREIRSRLDSASYMILPAFFILFVSYVALWFLWNLVLHHTSDASSLVLLLVPSLATAVTVTFLWQRIGDAKAVAKISDNEAGDLLQEIRSANVSKTAKWINTSKWILGVGRNVFLIPIGEIQDITVESLPSGAYLRIRHVSGKQYRFGSNNAQVQNIEQQIRKTAEYLREINPNIIVKNHMNQL